jgi:hypothetical protein
MARFGVARGELAHTLQKIPDGELNTRQTAQFANHFAQLLCAKWSITQSIKALRYFNQSIALFRGNQVACLRGIRGTPTRNSFARRERPLVGEVGGAASWQGLTLRVSDSGGGRDEKISS